MLSAILNHQEKQLCRTISKYMYFKPLNGYKVNKKFSQNMDEIELLP